MKKAEDCNTVDEVYACLKELEEDPTRLVRNAKELEQMEQENSWVYESNKCLALKKDPGLSRFP